MKLTLLRAAGGFGCMSCGAFYASSKIKDPIEQAVCLDQTCASHDGVDGINCMLSAAQNHGEASELEHEVGDLQDMLKAAWALLLPEQKLQLLRNPKVAEILQDEGGYHLGNPGLKSLPKTFVVIQEGGSSGELYASLFDNKRQVSAYQRSCEKSAYRTTVGVEVPGLIGLLPGFNEVAQELARAVSLAQM